MWVIMGAGWSPASKAWNFSPLAMACCAESHKTSLTKTVSKIIHLQRRELNVWPLHSSTGNWCRSQHKTLLVGHDRPTPNTHSVNS